MEPETLVLDEILLNRQPCSVLIAFPLIYQKLALLTLKAQIDCRDIFGQCTSIMEKLMSKLRGKQKIP
ncbi:MAG TPA: hypothetical protein [Caudoviricetes sp.]|nr:MAG TPA: hypothetical protein [Caudoviricetes sp.]